MSQLQIQAGLLHERVVVAPNSHFEANTQNSTVPQAVTVTLNLHPLDHASLQKASLAVGLDEAEFCALAVHRAARSVIDGKPFIGIV